MIHSTMSASTIIAQGLVDEEYVSLVCFFIFWGTAVYFFLAVGYKIMKVPTDKTLQKLSDSIIANSQKNSEALEELTRAVRELKDK